MPNWACFCAYPLAANQRNLVMDHQALLRRADWPAGFKEGYFISTLLIEMMAIPSKMPKTPSQGWVPCPGW